jgi:hypothetical protein
VAEVQPVGFPPQQFPRREMIAVRDRHVLMSSL